jgi:hypothetical protein
MIFDANSPDSVKTALYSAGPCMTLMLSGRDVTRRPDQSVISASVILRICFIMASVLAILTISYADPIEKKPSIKTVVIVKQQDSSRQMPLKEPLARLRVEVVSEMADKQKGLSGRESLPDDAGMLFVLEPVAVNFFWMKGMNFPLDILFFDRDRKLLSAAENLQPCVRCPWVRPPAGSVYALEINAGLTKKLGIREGDGFAFEDE